MQLSYGLTFHLYCKPTNLSTNHDLLTSSFWSYLSNKVIHSDMLKSFLLDNVCKFMNKKCLEH